MVDYFIQASPYCYKECDQLQMELKRACGHNDLHLVGVPMMNMYVAARFSEDDQLYRAKVTGQLYRAKVTGQD